MNVADLALKHIGRRIRVTEHALVIEGTLAHLQPITDTIFEPTIVEPNRVYSILRGAELHIGDNTIRVHHASTVELLEDEEPPAS